MTAFMLTMLAGVVVALWCRCSHLDQQVRQLHRQLDTADYRADLLSEEIDELAAAQQGDCWKLTEAAVAEAIQDLATRCAMLEARRTLNDIARTN